MKFSEKICLMIMLKVTKNQGFTLSLEDTLFEKPQEGEGQIGPALGSLTAVLGSNLLKRTSGIFLPL